MTIDDDDDDDDDGDECNYTNRQNEHHPSSEAVGQRSWSG